MNKKNMVNNSKRRRKGTSPVFTFIVTFAIFTGLALILLQFTKKDDALTSTEKFVPHDQGEGELKTPDTPPVRVPEINKILENPKIIKYQGNTDTHYTDELRAFLEIKNYPQFKEPIYQHTDNKFYLNHAGNKEPHFKGTAFMDYRVRLNSRKILIYAHNAKSLNMPFSIFENYRYKEFYDAFPVFKLRTNNGVKEYQIFSIYVDTSSFDYMRIDFKNEGDYYKHLLMHKKRSMYDTGVKVKPKDSVLVVQTCEEDPSLANVKHKYLVIMAKRIR